ncbi:Serine/threonine-protein kinase haspin [Araneus ventricosus]|uniref:non-specific serine/threonine protein kinase n=1 Tax=Araneus ventricosus TaxID=182803 RepID=A0A4Y2GEB7_ARAVE|nr:Serine/threonine-protein kinase haspin [Araneus ventricosus]
MKRVKCYGKAKVTTVDSSFKRNFFGSLDSRNSIGINNFQEFQQKGSSSFTSVASTSDYTNSHSCELFVSDADSCDGSLSTYSTCSSRNLRRKQKSIKHSVASKTYRLRKFSYTSASHSSLDLQPVLTSKAKKPLKKHTRTSRSCAKQRTSKQFKTSVKMTASYSSCTNLGLSYAKGRSKNAKRLKSYKKGALKRNCNTSRRHSLKKHSAIPIQPSCSEFCENPSSVINTGMKKPNKKGGGKKKQLINKGHQVAGSNHFSRYMAPSFNSKHDSFWAAIQPNWSSIYEYSFKIEKTSKDRKKTIPVFIEQHMNKNAAFPDLIDKDNKLLSNEKNISGGISVQSEVSSSCKHPFDVEKYKSTGEANVARNDNFSKQGSNLNINPSETVDSKLKTAKDISENVSVCKKSSAISCTDSVNDQILPEVVNAEIQHRSDEIASIVSNLCETVSEKLNVNEIAAINANENASKGISIETCKEVTKSNKGVISAAQTNFSASMTVSEGKNSFKRNKEIEYLSKNADPLQEYASAKPFKKSKGFYSSTPLTSPSTHATVAKKFPSTTAFSPVLQKGLFITSTPAHSSKVVISQQNQICNVSRISRLGRQCSLQDLSIDSSVKLQGCRLSTKIISSVLPRRNNSHASLINSSSHSNQNTHRTSRSCISFSRREQPALGESHHCSKSWSLMKEASSVASTSAESGFESTLSKLLDFCGQTRIIPFSELYNWSHTTVRKIGEGTYGEVFTLVQNKISSVIKVIPFSEEGGDHNMQSIESVLSEVTVSKCLSELRSNKTYKTRNFNKLKSVHLVRGYYPDQMLVAWDKFSDAKTTYNSRPDVFNDQQMFAIIELEYGGKDMTCFILRNAAEAESVLKQIAISLAIAEETHLFEHRDLHLGNILVQRNASKTISYVLGGKAYSIPNHGLIVTIIDFTLSRVLHEGCIFYNNLADDSLFDQTGDYQFQVYKDTKKLLNNEWHKCLLYSNVLWLTYLCVKLLENDYSRPSSKKHEEGLNNIKTFQNNVRNCENAFECLTTCNILMSVPKNKQGSAEKMAKRAKLVDRKSLQKSISHRASNVV